MINQKIQGPPTNPGTLKTNGVLIDTYLREYFNKYFPLYGYHITSGYRTQAENAAIPGAAPDSSHLYNLGRDFVILDQSAQTISEEIAKKLHSEFFTDWKGYSYFEPSSEGEGYHIHANLPREWSNKTKWIGALLTAGAGVFIVMKIWNSKQFIKFRNSFKKE